MSPFTRSRAGTPARIGVPLLILFSLAASACRTHLVLGDGIPRNGTTSMVTIENGITHQVLAFGQDGMGYRFEWDGSEQPGVSADDRDFDPLPDGKLVLIGYDDGEETGRLEVTAHAGEQARRFWLLGEEHPFDPEGAGWLARALPMLIDHAGLGAASRVPRLYAAGGMDAVLADTDRRQTDMARSEYYEFMVESELPSADVAHAVRHAGPRVESDPHLSDVLEAALEARPGDAAVLAGVLAAAQTIASDPHLADVLETVLAQGHAEGAVSSAVLELAAREIQSDPHLADLLEGVPVQQLSVSGVRRAFIAAVARVESDPHAADVLEGALRQCTDPAVVAELVAAAAAGIASDPHLADTLGEVRAQTLSDASVRAAMRAALATIQSRPHRDDVLERLPQGALDG